MRKKDPDPVEIRHAMDAEIGLFFTDLEVTIWLPYYSWSDHYYLTPDFSHFLISRVIHPEYNDILDVSLLKKEAEALSKTFSRYDRFKYIESSFKGISTAAKWETFVQAKQRGDIIEIINQDSYYKFNLKAGTIIDHIKLLAYKDGWGLTRMSKNLYLIEIESRKQIQLTENIGIDQVYLHSKDSYCLISCGSLVKYEFRAPFDILRSPSAKNDQQWEVFPLFEAESIWSINETEEDHVFRIVLNYYSYFSVLLNVKTGEHNNEEEDPKKRQ